MTAEFNVGDTVIVTSVNRRGPREAVVRKVGRTLVHVDSGWGNKTEAYRLDTLTRNDAYQHERIWPVAEWAKKQARDAARQRIVDRGLRFDAGREREFTTADLESIADLLDELAG